MEMKIVQIHVVDFIRVSVDFDLTCDLLMFLAGFARIFSDFIERVGPNWAYGFRGLALGQMAVLGAEASLWG